MSNDEGASLYLGYTTAPYSTANSTRGNIDCFPSIFDIGYWIFDIHHSGGFKAQINYSADEMKHYFDIRYFISLINHVSDASFPIIFSILGISSGRSTSGESYWVVSTKMR